MRAREKFYCFTFFYPVFRSSIQVIFSDMFGSENPLVFIAKIRQNIGVLLGITPFYR